MLGFEDLTNNIGIIQTLDPEAVDTSGDVGLTGVDGANCGSVLHIIGVGDTAEHSSSHHTRLVIQHCDDNATWLDVTDKNIVEFAINGVVTAMEDATTGLLKAIDAAADDNKVYTAEYKGQKRYSRILLEENGTTTTGDFSGHAIQWARARNAAAGVLGSN